MTRLVGSLPFIGAVILIALLAWAVRSFAESDPDPLILNFTFFAFAGQCILTPELLKAIDPEKVFGLLLVAAVLVVLQIFTVRDHADVTLECYRSVLENNKTDNCTEADINHWAVALVRFTGRDFAPQFDSESFGSESRGKRKREAIAVLPATLFKLGEGKITLSSLTVPDSLRIWRWRNYVAICIATWLVFLASILIVRNTNER
ncbi:MAG TPA: hypothetical protein VJU77_17145 [Chthoniobacterales bacterium]|nr:hypothetical protein [Chthoniobacterales bacterium]